MSNNIFKRQGRVILGVCSKLAQRTGVSPFVFRMIFVISLIYRIVYVIGFVVFSIDLYLGPSIFLSNIIFLAYFLIALFLLVNKLSKKGIFAIIGVILGIPLSYFFQSEAVRNWLGGIGGYIVNFSDIIDDSNLLLSVVLSVIIFGLIGGIIGYFMDKNEAKKTAD